MALLFCDSFDHYATADIFQKWTTFISSNDSYAIQSAAGRWSSSSLRLSASGGTRGVSKTLAPGDARFVCGFALNPATVGGGHFLSIHDDTVQHLTFNMLSSGQVEVRRGADNGTLLGTSSATAVFTTAQFRAVEVEATIADSGGIVKFWIDGILVLDLSSQDTRNGGTAGWTQVVLRSATSGNRDFDDLWVGDGTGSAFNAGGIGDKRVDAQRATANGNSSGSTPSTGIDRYATVDDTTTNGDTDYNTLATSGDKDTLGFQDAPVSGVAPLAVQVCISTKKTDAGAGALCPVIRHSGSDNDGTGVNVTTSYSMVRQVYEQNPGAGPGAWTEADFNAAEFGYKRTA